MTVFARIAGLMALALVAVTGVAAARSPSPGQAYMAVPKGSVAGKLLDYTELKLPSVYRARAWRMLYVTNDDKRRPILSTGLVVLSGYAPKDPKARDFVAWAHPTYGIARKCAPSLRGSPFKAIEGLNELISAGVIVTASDYPGLGTEGPVGYLVGKGQAYAVLDSIRAAKQIPGVGGGSDFALWGYSQGGHAVIFAADLARGYAPELTLKGVAAVAPPTNLPVLLTATIKTVAGRVLAAMTIASWYVKYNAPLDPLIDDQVKHVVGAVSRNCVDDLGGQIDALAAQKPLQQKFLNYDPTKLKPWSGLLGENSKYGLTVPVPALILQGSNDDIVKPEVTTQFVRNSCRAGVPVQYVILKGKGHTKSVDAGKVQAVNWLAARLKGQPAKGNCR